MSANADYVHESVCCAEIVEVKVKDKGPEIQMKCLTEHPRISVNLS